MEYFYTFCAGFAAGGALLYLAGRARLRRMIQNELLTLGSTVTSDGKLILEAVKKHL